MEKYAVAEHDVVEAKAIELVKTAGISMPEARAVAVSLIDKKK